MSETLELNPSQLSMPIAEGILLERKLFDSIPINYFLKGVTTQEDKSLLVGLPWGENVARPDALSRYSVLQEALGGRVVAIDNVGVGDDAQGLTRAQRKNVANGYLGEFAKEQYEIVKYMLGEAPSFRRLFYGRDDYCQHAS